MANYEARKILTKKERRKIRSRFAHDMKPHIFDRIATSIPYVFMGLLNKIREE